MKYICALYILSFALSGCGTSAYLIKQKKCEQLGAEYLHCKSEYVEALD